jgi:hypothetical protein
MFCVALCKQQTNFKLVIQNTKIIIMCTPLLLGRRIIRLPLNYLGYSIYTSQCIHKMWIPSMNQCRLRYTAQRFFHEKSGSTSVGNNDITEKVVSSLETDPQKTLDDISDKFQNKTEQVNSIVSSEKVTIEQLQDRILRLLAENENIIQRHIEEVRSKLIKFFCFVLIE